MPPKNTNKNKDVLKELEKTISPVLIINNSSLKPYVELFEYEPENIYQQPLGSLVGFFEVKEFSDDSAYIVNHLTAVLKKEYYINPKRPVTESLDSALHKVNLALSEIARIGNVEWLGKINAAICVLEKNNAHFSVSGNAKIFLHRNTILSEISEDLASDSPEPHPLKTFINVSSGRLEKNDRLLITSGDIFHILSTTEIKKNFERFEGEKFVQFLRTALSNQMEMIASIVIEMAEPAPEVAKKAMPRKKSANATNVFSETTFANSSPAQNLAENDEFNETEEIVEDANYTDKKTGHIYIQGEAIDPSKSTNSQVGLYQDLIKEKISQGIFLTKNELRKRFSLYKKQLAKKRALRQAERERQLQLQAEENKRLEEQRVLDEIEREQRLVEEKELERIRLEQEAIEQKRLAKLATKIVVVKEEPVENLPAQEPAEIEEVQIEERELSFKEKLALIKLEQQHNAVIDLRKKTPTPTPLEDLQEDADDDFEEEYDEESEFNEIENVSKLQALKSLASNMVGKISPALKHAKEATLTHTKKLRTKVASKTQAKKAVHTESELSIVPHFSKISNLFSRFSGKQKLYTLGALILIFIVPLFIVHFMNKPKAPTIADLQVVSMSAAELLANEKNIQFNTETRTIFPNSNIVTSLIAGDSTAIITKASIVLLQNNQPTEFQLPAGSGTSIRATFMNDLSLIFVLTDSGKVISFSPISKKFTDNKIDLAGVSSTSFVGTYLTYLYVLDQKSSQIYRYPRADGGFGARTEWLKDSTPLSQVSEMTIDDNIYAVQNNQVLKFFKGKKVDFSLEDSNTPVHFDKLFTTPDLQSIYALDIKNSRVIVFSKDGSILSQYWNDAFKDGSSLSVDEKNKIAFIGTSSGLIEMKLQ